MATWTKLSFMDGASKLMEYLMAFHDHAMSILVVILTLVGYLLVAIVMGGFTSKSTLEHQAVEMMWTVLPGIVLVFIAFPSLRILYLSDELGSVGVTLKVMGHQWYWSYEYTDFGSKELDTYMVGNEEENNFRLLDVDNRIVLPSWSVTRVIVSALDVIHSWTLPTMGLKVDAVPGRLNQTVMKPQEVGIYYGQCSEICGANHSFMPIVLEVVSAKIFLQWLSEV